MSRQQPHPIAQSSIAVRLSLLILLYSSVQCTTDPRVALSQGNMGRHIWDVPLSWNTDAALQVSTTYVFSIVTSTLTT